MKLAERQLILNTIVYLTNILYGDITDIPITPKQREQIETIINNLKQL